MNTISQNNRVLSGMRPTGLLHLGHYHGVLKNWIELQHSYECFYFVADWHALTTHYEDPSIIHESTRDMVIDWLAAGVNPGSATLFIQSRIPEHAELHTLLSMITPLGWLERVPSYKDQQEKIKDKDLATYGFLGYPLLQSADILMYKAGYVPVGFNTGCSCATWKYLIRKPGGEPREVDHLPRPRVAVLVGTCACSMGIYKDAYSVAGPPDKVLREVDPDATFVYVPGCPPKPETIIAAVVKLLEAL